MKKITQEQIQAVLQTVYNTSITAQQFDALKEFFAKLPDVEEKKDKK